MMSVTKYATVTYTKYIGMYKYISSSKTNVYHANWYDFDASYFLSNKNYKND